MAFHLGSLGFLTPFEFNNFQDQVMNVLEGKHNTFLHKKLDFGGLQVLAIMVWLGALKNG